MNRMDCFRRQPSEFHRCYNTIMPIPKSYEVNHAAVLMNLTTEWKSTHEIYKASDKKVSEYTTRVHLKILFSEGKIYKRLKEGIWEWRRA